MHLPARVEPAKNSPALRPRNWTIILPAGLACLLLLECGCSRGRPYEGKSVDQLTQMLQSDDPIKQVQGAFGLGQVGPQAKEAGPALIHALKDRHTSVRENAALALGKISPDVTEAMPALTDALRDPEVTVRRQAAIALGRIGHEARAALPGLEKASRDPDHLVREAAKDAVSKIRK
jgi:HEAT repeat protein